jgi:hypothetical protein
LRVESLPYIAAKDGAGSGRDRAGQGRVREEIALKQK